MPKYEMEAAHILLPLDKIRRWEYHATIEVQMRGLAEHFLTQQQAEHPYLLWRLNEVRVDEEGHAYLLDSRDQIETDISSLNPNKLEDLEQTVVLRGLIAAGRQDPTDRVVRAVLLDYLVEEARLDKARSEALIDTIERRVWARKQLRRDTQPGRRMRANIYSAVGRRYTSKIRIVVLTGNAVEQLPQLEEVEGYYTHTDQGGRRCPCPHHEECRGHTHRYHRARSRVTVGELALLELQQFSPSVLIV